MIQTLLLLKNRKVYDEKDKDSQIWRRVLLLAIGGLLTVAILSVLLAKAYLNGIAYLLLAMYGILFWDAFGRFPASFDTFSGRLVESFVLAFLELVAVGLSYGIVEFGSRMMKHLIHK
jgi:hypothetical protein